MMVFFLTAYLNVVHWSFVIRVRRSPLIGRRSSQINAENIYVCFISYILIICVHLRPQKELPILSSYTAATIQPNQNIIEISLKYLQGKIFEMIFGETHFNFLVGHLFLCYSLFNFNTEMPSRFF
jgi:hypothetical protein